MTMPIVKDIELDDYSPWRDSERIADNTLQYSWIVTIQGNIDAMYSLDPKVFVAGDLIWYPVKGKVKVRAAPDVMVAFGRPKGYRGSYKQWEEDGIAPQVVFEILSPRVRPEEMDRKLEFYDRYGVEEYYIYDPDEIELSGYRLIQNQLQQIETMNGWVSPRLGIRFELPGHDLVIKRPDGQQFLTFVELATEREQARQRADRLAARLRELGEDPDR